ncbi:uncharacterized protein [Pleurodeles waltl]|uniref:uncharacterized protein isoform X1 n=1 Tax=Pleurodeles waltl TaxID=8319 RepID=UPI00370987C6
METREVLVQYIQEFYEVTLLDLHKTCEEKLQDAEDVTVLWADGASPASAKGNLQEVPESASINGSDGYGSSEETKTDSASLETSASEMKPKTGEPESHI